MNFHGTSGDDDFRGTNKGDYFYLSGGGVDTVAGHDGDDKIFVAKDQVLMPGERFDGGDGHDTLSISKDVPDGFAFTGDNFVDFEAMMIFRSARVTMADACDPKGHSLSLTLYGHGYNIDASAVTGTLTLDLYNNVRINHARFLAGSGDDVLHGGFGRDHLDGGAGNDTLEGSIGGDRLTGGAGDDIIGGGYGYDKLTGGTGADVFKQLASNDPRFFDNDVITDFKVSEDKVLIYSSDLRSYDQLTFEDDGRGGTIVVFYQNQSVHLRHVAPNTLSESNFIFQKPGESQPQHLGGISRRPEFDSLPSHSTVADMHGTHVTPGDLHIMAHMMIA